MYKKKIFFLCKKKIFFLYKKKIFFLHKKKIFFLYKKKIFFLQIWSGTRANAEGVGGTLPLSGYPGGGI